VPTWAFLNVTATNDNFDPAKASSLAVASSPTSSASTSSAATSSTSTSTSHQLMTHLRHNGTTPAPIPLTERPISTRIVSRDASQELYNSGEIFPIPPTKAERTPQDEVVSDPRRPSGQPPRRLVHSIQTDSGTTWYSE